MKYIAILEDNAERRAEMLRQLDDRLYMFPVVIFREAKPLCDFVSRHPDQLLVVSLDHDLDDVNGEEAGTGRLVADFLAEHRPLAPVIVHSSNGPAADGMIRVLKESDWSVRRVVPFEDLSWIRRLWLRAVKDAVPVATAESESQKLVANDSSPESSRVIATTLLNALPKSVVSSLAGAIVAGAVSSLIGAVARAVPREQESH